MVSSQISFLSFILIEVRLIKLLQIAFSLFLKFLNYIPWFYLLFCLIFLFTGVRNLEVKRACSAPVYVWQKAMAALESNHFFVPFRQTFQVTDLAVWLLWEKE